MCRKAAETTRNISDAFGPGIANKHTVQWWFKKFCKGDKNLEHEEYSGRPLEVDNDQLRVIIEADPVPTHKKLPKNSTSTILQSFGIWRKLERWISLISRCFMRWPEIKKIVILKCCFLLFYTTPTIISLSDCDVDEKWLLYNSWWWPAQWLDWEAPKHFPKPNLNQKKRLWSVWWSAACLIHYSFLNLDKTITSEKYTHQIDELHQKLQYLSQHRSTKRAQFFSTNLTACQTTASKVGTNWTTKFCFIHHI